MSVLQLHPKDRVFKCIVCKYFSITLHQYSTVYKGNYNQYHCNNLLEGIL